MNRPRD